jgi:NAD(P)-dependent dehydrogenase (short-subunit alcohol dehydrogenase family)
MFENQVAVVTGAARGIGLAIAQRLAASGALVVMSDVDADEVEAAAVSLRNRNLCASSCACDVRMREQTDALSSEVARRHGAAHILVNNAGIVRDAALHKMTDEQWDLVNDVISGGTFNMCRSFAGLLREVPSDARHRKVINVTSVSGVYGRELSVNYSAAKAAVIGLTKALAREWAGRKVNVNAVAPGFIGGTRLTTPTDDGRTGMRQDFFERMSAQIPIGRVGQPQDVAALACFLASADADYITGQVIEIHGGLEILRV